MCGDVRSNKIQFNRNKKAPAAKYVPCMLIQSILLIKKAEMRLRMSVFVCTFDGTKAASTLSASAFS